MFALHIVLAIDKYFNLNVQKYTGNSQNRYRPNILELVELLGKCAYYST